MAAVRPELDAGAERPDDFVQSLARGLSVIRAFSAEHPELSLSEVARATGLTRAAARRFLLTLESLGYVGSSGRLFRLRLPVLDLGYAYLSSMGLADITQLHLHTLSEDLQESCGASVLDDSDIVHIARATSDRLMAVRIDLGRRIPAYATSMGRVLLAALPDAELTAYFARHERPALSPHTATGEDELRRILAQVRRDGHAMVDQELEEGIRSIAVPVHGPRGGVVAAINTSAHTSRVTVERLREHFLPRLAATATSIEHDLEMARR
ncbi:helix-turn-helix domain-containing protein [Nocardioides anomalus]|uniref:Helix-turn-helix domain-containing protein n=1 Tax=Nocardioides anomalus TaxID=2712223 RepID=A0A6G6W9W0_9ACTN|nr:IclR family transcriptional regulator C-terminal domain-containing protein [Nocardioides anomalus]QIG42006.1 helix-turn-helix domain-containing protein [Nocardioides anomalus]